MVLMRVGNGDIKREWVHFSLWSDIPLLPPEALEGAFGEGATMLQILLLLLLLLSGLIVEDIDLGKEERVERGGAKLGEGWRWLTVQAGCLTCGEFISFLKATACSRRGAVLEAKSEGKGERIKRRQ